MNSAVMTMLQSNVSIGAKTRRLVAISLAIAIGVTKPARAADDSHLAVEATAAQKDFYFEAVIQSLSIMYKGAGEEQKGLCVTDMYFGSPLSLRVVLDGFWRGRTGTEEVGIAVFDTLCADRKPPDPDGAKLWQFAAKSHGSVPAWATSDWTVLLFAGMRTMFSFAAVQLKDKALARCILERYDETLVDNVHKRGGPVLPALYDEMRAVCGLFPNGPASKNMVGAKIPDVDGAARERLLTVSQMRACDRRSDRSSCMDELFKARIEELR